MDHYIYINVECANQFLRILKEPKVRSFRTDFDKFQKLELP